VSWLSALSALARLLLAVAEAARERRARGAGRAKAATHALHLISAAREARRAAASRDADPDRLRDDDGHRGRTDTIACTARSVEEIGVVGFARHALAPRRSRSD
jgi:hypothetical protein